MEDITTLRELCGLFRFNLLLFLLNREERAKLDIQPDNSRPDIPQFVRIEASLLNAQ